MTIRKLRYPAMAAASLGLALLAHGRTSPLQDATASVDVINRNSESIRIKRVGFQDNDLTSVDLAAGESTTFQDIALQGDQSFTAWTLGGRCIGSTKVSAATASQYKVTLNVGPQTIGPALQPKGGRPGQGPSNPGGAATAPNPGEFQARNLGIYYQHVRFDDGTFGARLTRPPAAGSPAASLQLEPGDTIVSLDDLTFRVDDDILRHFDQTSMVFINIRTGQNQAANLILPPQ